MIEEIVLKYNETDSQGYSQEAPEKISAPSKKVNHHPYSQSPEGNFQVVKKLLRHETQDIHRWFQKDENKKDAQARDNQTTEKRSGKCHQE